MNPIQVCRKSASSLSHAMRISNLLSISSVIKWPNRFLFMQHHIILSSIDSSKFHTWQITSSHQLIAAVNGLYFYSKDEWYEVFLMAIPATMPNRSNVETKQKPYQEVATSSIFKIFKTVTIRWMFFHIHGLQTWFICCFQQPNSRIQNHTKS